LEPEMKRSIPLLTFVSLAALLTVLHAQVASIHLTVDQILHPSPDSWPTYNGDYSGRRFSTLAKINDKNVKSLSLAWTVPVTGAAIKGTPLLVNGTLFVTSPDNVTATDARTGREMWHYTWVRNRGGIHIGNRGVAIYGDTVYFETPDCNLVALSAETGREKWFKSICASELMYYGSVAPTVVKDKLIVGVSGDDLDEPGYLDARNLDTGELIWRWYATPQKAGDPGLDTWPNLEEAKHGGGMTWQPVTYDPEQNLIFVSTGNPQPVIAYKNRQGANLFTASLVALNADTGKMSWYFQTSPHDTHDEDSTQVPVLFEQNGRKLVAQALRNGKFFVIDRTTGKGVVSNEFIKTKQFLGYDAKGQPIPNPAKDPAPDGTISTNSATNWYPASYSPLTGLFYVNASRSFGIYYVYDLSDNPQGWGGGGGNGGAPGGEALLEAVDVKTGQIKWATPRYGGGSSGVLSTAGNLVFGSGSGGLAAYNATTGTPLWASRVGNITNGPITYLLDGRQYVTAAAGTQLYSFVLNE
jgi:alcohol dehydrogenase (cytochrome c)